MDTTVLQEVVVRLLQERVAIVACLNSVVVASTWSQFNVSECALHVEPEANAVEPLWLDSSVILLVCVRPWRDEGLLHLFIPECELLGLA